MSGKQVLHLITEDGWVLSKYTRKGKMHVGFNAKEQMFVPYTTPPNSGLVTFGERSRSLDEAIKAVQLMLEVES